MRDEISAVVESGKMVKAPLFWFAPIILLRESEMSVAIMQKQWIKPQYIPYVAYGMPSSLVFATL